MIHFLTKKRKEELYKGNIGNEEYIEIPYDSLNDEEKEIFKSNCFLTRKRHNYAYAVLTDKKIEYPKKSESFLDGADDVRKVIYSFICEIAEDRKKAKKNNYSGIESIVDILQETNNKFAENVLSTYKILQAMEVIRNNRKQDLGSAIRKEKINNDIYYSEELGISKQETTILDKEGDKIYDRNYIPLDLKDVDIVQLLYILLRNIDIPGSISL